MAKNKGIAAAKREERRRDAERRKADYDALTPQQKLKMLDDGGFRAERQRARIQAQIDAGK